MANTELVTVTKEYLALSPDSMMETMEILRENQKNMANEATPFDVIKAPAGGGTFFTVPGLQGDEAVKELKGVFLDYTTPRAYWDTPDPVESTPPNCHSKDSIIAYNGFLCRTCDFNEFGSKEDSNAKACREYIEIYFLRPDSMMPIIVRVPASSKTAFRKYMGKLTNAQKPLFGVVTKITLESAKSTNGQPYAKYVFAADKILTPEETQQIREYKEKFMSAISDGNAEASA